MGASMNGIRDMGNDRKRTGRAVCDHRTLQQEAWFESNYMVGTECPPYGTQLKPRRSIKSCVTRALITAPTIFLFSLFSLSCLANEWVVRQSRDQITQKALRTITLSSADTVNLEWPYGKVSGRLVIRQTDEEESSVFLQLSNGQIVCDHTQCGATIRFDDSKPVRFGGTQSSDGDSRVMFLQPVSEFIESASTARRIFVEFVAYRSGKKVLSFRPKTALRVPTLGSTQSAISRKDLGLAEDECRSKSEMIECLVQVRQCFANATGNLSAEDACKNKWREFN
jgi:hypothetical protein